MPFFDADTGMLFLAGKVCFECDAFCETKRGVTKQLNTQCCEDKLMSTSESVGSCK